MKKLLLLLLLVLSVLSSIFHSCGERVASPGPFAIKELNLKRGKLISCGPADQQFGTVEFEVSCSEKLKQDFNLAVKLLHSFEYDEAEKVFAKIIDEQPTCAMAYWGVAMSNFHPLWTPPTEAELKKGIQAIAIARDIDQKTKREAAYIDAIYVFYKDWDKIDHRTRCISFEKAMEELYTRHPEDKEAAIFYALALNAAADPTDKSFGKQKKAGAILGKLYRTLPTHPGIVHYIIHTYDYPELASLALPAARKYASVAPSSAHALHMPSHIFTRLGLWDECIKSNLESVSSAQCYAQSTGIKGHWDEELHGMDYLVYAYLQKGEHELAKKQWEYLKTIKEVYPANFKVAYAFAAIPSRYLLENRLWKEAANLQVYPANFDWKDFPWQKAIIHFTRLMGSVHAGDLDKANVELKALNGTYDRLIAHKDSYKANQVLIQIKTAEAWIQFKNGNTEKGLTLMKLAANMEDKTEKHPVTPGEVIPARELLGDMLLQMNKPGEALQAYEADLKQHANRYNGLYGAGLAADKSGNKEKASFYYQKLLEMVGTDGSDRQDLTAIKKRIEAGLSN